MGTLTNLRMIHNVMMKKDCSKLPPKIKKEIRKFVCDNPEFKKYDKDQQKKALEAYGL